MLPWMNKNGKIITIGSQEGKFNCVFRDSKLADTYRKENITMDELKQMVKTFENDIRSN
jgi:hypothetical protein